ncbi:MAG TPA: ATP-binding protein [Polyangia bacterium]|jgi:PAS domain S-box-containing protein
MDDPSVISSRLSGVADAKALLEGLFFHAPVAFQVYRADGHSLVVNPAFRELFGSEPPPAYNCLQDELVSPEALALIRRAFTGETVQLPIQWYDAHQLKQVTVEKSRRVAMRVTFFPLFDSERVVRHVGVAVHDVTSEETLKLAGEESRLKEERLRLALAAGRMVTLDTHLESNRVYVSDNAWAILGLSPDVPLATFDDWFSLFHPEDRAVMQEEMSQSPQRVPRLDRTFRIVLPHSGEIRWIERRGRPSSAERGDAGGTWVRGIVMDITERVRAEEEHRRLESVLRTTEDQLRQSQKMEAIGRLAGGIAHDFNNLLSVVLSYSDMLITSNAVREPFAADLREIRGAAERAANLTRSLLAFSRQQVLEPTVLDLNEVVRSMDKMLRRVIGEDIDLRWVADSALGRVKVDPGQIEQVLMNLAVNARDAMPMGGMLTLETANIDIGEDYVRDHVGVTPGPHVMLAVTDTGAGMSKEVQAKIFEPFFTTKDLGKGTGLGLSTVFGIVRQSGGHIWVYSEPGQGTTFKLYFPRTDQIAEGKARAAMPPASLRGSETVLLVEDDEQLRIVGQTILAKNGYRVIVADGPADALDQCEQVPDDIHLLVTDVVMPGMNGLQLATRATRLRPAMKVLYVSGYTNNTIVHHGVLDEGVAFLQKPITPDALLRKVREVLDEVADGEPSP